MLQEGENEKIEKMFSCGVLHYDSYVDTGNGGSGKNHNT